MGFLLPPVRVTDNMRLKSREYVFLIKGGEVARFELQSGCELAIPTPRAKAIEAQSTIEPAFGLQAYWVPAERAELTRSSGYTVVDHINVIGTHLTELVRRFSWEVFSRQDAKVFCDRVAQDSPKVVEDLVPKLLSLAAVQKVVQNLLREAVPIRDGLSILEALGEAAASTKNPVLLTEYVRQAIRRTLVKPYLNPGGELKVWFLDSTLERLVESAIEHGEQTSVCGLPPQAARELLNKIGAAVGNTGTPTPVICGAAARPFLRQLVENSYWHVFFLSHNEVPAGTKVQSLGVIQ
jgi:flagellar biosynthesis protein FlhA